MDILELNHLLIHRSTTSDLKGLEYIFSKQNEETHIQILYNLLLEDKVFDQDRITNKWRTYDKKKPLTVKALENTKTNLKNSLLVTLGINNQYIINGDAERALYNAEAYIQRQLFLQAFAELDGIVRDDTIFLYPNYRISILQKILWLLPLIKPEAYDKKREHYLVLLQSAMDEMLLFYEVFVLNNNVSDLASRNVVMKSADSKAELKNLLKHRILKLNYTKLPHVSAAYFIKTSITLHYLAGEPLKQFDMQMEFCTLLRRFEKQYLYSTEYLNYVGEFSNLVTLAAQLQKEAVFELTLYYLKSIIHINRQYVPVFQAQVLLLETMQFYYKKDFKQMLPLLEKADSYIKKNIDSSPALHSDNFKLGLMKCWLAVKNFEKVKYWFGNRSGIKPIVRLDSYFTIYVIYVCSLYEQFSCNGKIISLPAGFKTWVDNLRSMQTHNKMILPLEASVTDTFMQLAESVDKDQHHKLLASLLKKLNQLPLRGHIYQEQFYRIFDLKGWVNERIKKVKNK